MPHTLRLNGKLGVIVLRYRASTDFSEIRNVFDELVRVPGFKAGLYLVADFHNANCLLTGAEIDQLALYATNTDAQWGVTKWLIIASQDVTYGLARMYSSLTNTYNVTTNVFRTAQDADDWFGIGIDVTDILAQTPE